MKCGPRQYEKRDVSRTRATPARTGTRELLAHVRYDAQRLPLAAKECEQEWIGVLREQNAPLLNVNSSFDRKQARREYMRAWRIAHGQGGPPGTSYMAQKGREARERRREAMEVGGGV